MRERKEHIRETGSWKEGRVKRKPFVLISYRVSIDAEK